MSIQLVSATPTERRQFERARETLEGTRSGRAVVEQLERDDTRIEFVADGHAEHHRGKNYIRLPREMMVDAKLGATVLAHEGQHRIDDARGPNQVSGPKVLMSGARSAIDGIVHLRNPISAMMNAIETESHATEITAYEREGTVARELGMNLNDYSFRQGKERVSYSSAMSSHDATGRVKSREQLAEEIAAQPEYQLPLVFRTGTPLALSGLTGLVLGGVTRLVTRSAGAGMLVGVAAAAVGMGLTAKDAGERVIGQRYDAAAAGAGTEAGAEARRRQ